MGLAVGQAVGQAVGPHPADVRCCSADSALVSWATRLCSGPSRSATGIAKAVRWEEGRRGCDRSGVSGELAEVAEEEIPARDEDGKGRAATKLVVGKGLVVDHSWMVKMVVGANVDPGLPEEVAIVAEDARVGEERSDSP